MSRLWAEADLELLRRNYADSRSADIAAALDRPVGHIYQAAARLGLLKSAEYLASPDACRLRRGDNVGIAHRFKAGEPSWSKGTKGRVGVQEGCRATQFKRGRPACEARNYLPIGSHRVSKDGYLERKLTDDPSIAPVRRWVGVHRLVWEAANGPVPHGHAVTFLPGRRTADEAAIALDALELVSRADLMRRNTIHRYGREIALAVRLRGAITRQINKRATA